MATDPPNPLDDDPINANLKRVYNETLTEEVPDRFRDLLAQLKQQDATDATSNSEGEQ